MAKDLIKSKNKRLCFMAFTVADPSVTGVRRASSLPAFSRRGSEKIMAYNATSKGIFQSSDSSEGFSKP